MDLVSELEMARKRIGGLPRAGYLVGYDANGIQALITAANRPAMMQGASRIIVEFDASQTRKPSCAFAAGGRGRFVVDSEEGAERLAQELRAEYWGATRGEVLGVAISPYEESREVECLQRLSRKTRNAKDEAIPPAWSAFTPEVAEKKWCQACYQWPAAEPIGGDEIEPPAEVCQRCFAQRKSRERLPEGQRSAPTMDDIAYDNRVVTIAADGNGMGKIFDAAKTLHKQALLSAGVQVVFFNAAAKAAGAVDGLPDNPKARQVYKGRRIVPLVTGGDDVRAFMDPRGLEGFVTTFAKEVERGWAELQRQVPEPLDTLAVGMGVLVTHGHFPAERLLELSTGLEEHAKRAHGAVSAVALHCMGAPGELIEGFADDPSVYPVEEQWQALMQHARALAAVPSSQRAWIHSKVRAKEVDTEESQLYFRYQVARSPAWTSYVCTKLKFGSERLPNEAEIRSAMPTRDELDLASLLGKEATS